ncbi:UNVERIFIED_CONTAM: hypothetical protein Sindi_0857300 [Sesamum indicum]
MFIARCTYTLSVSCSYLALDGIYRPIGAAFPNSSIRRQRLVVPQGLGTMGLSPSPAPLSRGLGPGPLVRTLSISDAYERINEIPTIPVYNPAKPQPRERACQLCRNYLRLRN